MQISRLLEIVYLLLEHGSVTASELAERFEVSVRTVYRDMDALGEAGIPVCADRGRQGGFHLMENFSLNRSLLSKREQDEILFALQTLNATSAAECGQLLSRLSGLFRRDCTDWIEVDFSEWGNEKEQRERFEQVKSAILDCRVIRFVYYGSDGNQSERKVEPLRLLFKGSWYLQAFCLTRQDFRTFRLSRMEHVTTEEPFEKRPLGPPPVAMAASGAPEVKLLLRFSPQAAFRVYDEFSPEQVEKQEDGGFLVHASFPEGGWVYGYLLSFGEDAAVLSPERVRQILLKKAERIGKIYQQPLNMTYPCQVKPSILETSSKQKREGAKNMELQLKYLPEFTVAGVLGEGKAEEGPKWVLPLWEKSNREAGTMTGGVWGIMGHPDRYLGRWDERGLYLAGREVGAETKVPDGWTRWTVPAQTYLVADCSLTGYGDIFGRVLNEYLPAHGLEMIGAAHEHYPDPQNPEHVELWFPIAAGYRFCQSCGMPLTDVSQLATDAQGEPEYDYCTYCRQKGAFTADCTMEQMIDFCLDLGEKSGMYPDREEASRQMHAYFPMLKRWKTV